MSLTLKGLTIIFNVSEWALSLTQPASSLVTYCIWAFMLNFVASSSEQVTEI